MKELLENIAKNLVDKPDQVQVIQGGDAENITLTLHVANEDMGKVIGKQGKIAKAIRNVVKAAAIHRQVRVTIEIA